MCLLTRKETGFYFLARKTTESKLLEFNIPEMAMKMKDLAPHLWELLNILLEANPRLTNKRNWARKKAESLGKARHRMKKNTMADGEMELADIVAEENMPNAEEDEYWAAFDREEFSLNDHDEDEPVKIIMEDIQEQFMHLKSIVRI